MDKLKYIKLENEDGSYSESIPLSVDGNYIDINGDSLIKKLSEKADQSSIEVIQNQIVGLENGSPLVASSINEMTDTSRTYVNTIDGKWYYYNNSSWVPGGVYQSTAIAAESVSPLMLNNKTKENIKTRIPQLTIIDNEYIRYNNTIAQLNNTYRSEPFILYKGETLVLNAKGYLTNVGMIAECSEDKTFINIVARSTTSANAFYEYTAFNDTYIMISYLPGPVEYYIYQKEDLKEFDNKNYNLSNYNSLLIDDDINYRQVTHVLNSIEDNLFVNESVITVNTTSTKVSGWNWSVFKNFDVSNYNDGSYVVTAVLDIKNDNPVWLHLLSNGYSPFKKTIIKASNEYQRVILSGINPENNNIIRICLGSQEEKAQQNIISIRLMGLFINQKDSLIYQNPLTYKDLKYLLQQKNKHKYPCFSIIGDSYSAYKDWIPNDGRWSWYKPEGNTGTNNVSSVTQMWWYKLAQKMNSSLLYLDGWSGSTICTTGQNGADVSNSAMVNRINDSMGANRILEPKPNLIFVFGGTNDSWMNSPIGQPKYEDWTSDDLKSVLPAFCKMIDTIKTYNPGARIINIVNTDIKTAIKDGMASICEHYEIENIVPLDIEKESGHPNQAGMISIAEQIFKII